MASKPKKVVRRRTTAKIAPMAPPERQSRGIVTRVNPEGLKALRLLSVELDRPLQALGIEALNDLLKKYGSQPVVKNPLLDSNNGDMSPSKIERNR
jgi:hypothetical protein